MITWLASYPKSGNTWLRCFLAAYVTGRLDINHLSPFSHDDMSPPLWQLISPKSLDRLNGHEAFALRGHFLLTLLSCNQGKVVIKTHSGVGMVNEFPTIPEILTERAVYLVRDPRDVALSQAHHLQISPEEVVKAMGDPSAIHTKGPGLYSAIGSWSQNAMGWATSKRFPVHVVKYEELCHAPAETFRKILEFLNFRMDEERLTKAVELASFANLAAQEKTKGFREAYQPEGHDRPVTFFRRGTIGLWRDELEPDLVSRIERDHGEAMEFFGYAVGVRSAEQSAA